MDLYHTKQMTEAEFQEQQKRDMRMLADIGYAKGFNSACNLLDQALSMLGAITISVEHAKRMVDIIRRMQADYEPDKKD